MPPLAKVPCHCGGLSDHHPLLFCALEDPGCLGELSKRCPLGFLVSACDFPASPVFFRCGFRLFFFFVYFFILFLFGEGTTKIGVSQCLHSGAGAHRATPKPDCALGNPQSFFPRAQLPRVAPHRGPILRGLRARGKLQRLSPSRLPGSHPPIQACGGPLPLLQRNRFQTPRIRARAVAEPSGGVRKGFPDL